MLLIATYLTKVQIRKRLSLHRMFFWIGPKSMDDQLVRQLVRFGEETHLDQDWFATTADEKRERRKGTRRIEDRKGKIPRKRNSQFVCKREACICVLPLIQNYLWEIVVNCFNCLKIMGYRADSRYTIETIQADNYAEMNLFLHMKKTLRRRFDFVIIKG